MSPEADLRATGDLVARARAAGLSLEVRDGDLIVGGAGPKQAPLVEALTRAKPSVAAYLIRSPRALLSEPHPAFAPVGAGGFAELLEPQRYLYRQSAFDGMVAAAQSHYWTPFDARYLDFAAPFDTAIQPLAEDSWFPALRAPSVRERLRRPGDRTRFINQVMWMRLSTLLHGEQGALNLSASLCGVLKDQGAQEFASNQTREEARHVAAFSLYIRERWGAPAPCLPQLRDFLQEIIGSDDVSRKIIGMQIIVEGLAMGALAELYQMLLDPVGKRLVQFVMTDEAFHHRFGKLWCDLSLAQLPEADRANLEAWTHDCLRRFITRMNPPYEQIVLRQEFGIDPAVVARELQALANAGTEATSTAQRTFRVLTRILNESGLLNDTARQAYSAFLDTVPEAQIEAAIVAEGLTLLRQAHVG
jgi:hypothetical protein